MNIDYHFSNEVRAALGACGWSSERDVSILSLLDCLDKHGYQPHKRAEFFYRAFLGLVVIGRGRLGISFATVEHVAKATPQERLQRSDDLSINLAPIGSSTEGLFLSEDGQVVMIDTEGSCLACFSSLERAMDVLLGHRCPNFPKGGELEN